MPRIPLMVGTLKGSRGQPVTRNAGPSSMLAVDMSYDGAGGLTVELFSMMDTPFVRLHLHTRTFNGTLYNGPLLNMAVKLPPYDETAPACLTKMALRSACEYYANDARYREDARALDNGIRARAALGTPSPEQMPTRRRH